MGAAALGGVVHTFAKLPRQDKSQLKDRFIGRLEKKHNEAINKIEGWGDV
jgi:hypothetical protein